MTATPTSGTQTASEPTTVARFGSTERAVHWVHAGAFLGMFATGLALYLPILATLVGDRPLLKALHLAIASLWLTALLVLAIAGDRRRLRRTRRQLERFSDDDLRWLARRPARPGRFNAGQKLHAALQAALSVLFVVTGALLWLGERNTSLRFAGTIAVHDACMFFAGALVLGHLHMALNHPPTRPALRGMKDGRVDAKYAREQHPGWIPEAAVQWRPSSRALGLALVSAIAGLAATVILVADVLNS